jgi:hypothetical protein
MAYAGPVDVESSEGELQDGGLAAAPDAALGLGAKPSVKTGMGLRPRPLDHPPPGWAWRRESKTEPAPAAGKAVEEVSTTAETAESTVARCARITELQNEIGMLEREAEKRRRIEEKKPSAEVVPSRNRTLRPKPTKTRHPPLMPTKPKAGAKAKAGMPASSTDRTFCPIGMSPQRAMQIAEMRQGPGGARTAFSEGLAGTARSA